MNCLRCNTTNLDGARICKGCGADMTFANSYANSNLSLPDIILLIYLGISLLSLIIQILINKSIIDSSNGLMKYVIGLFWILQNLSIILLPLLINNKSIKIIGLIVASIVAITYAYGNIKFLLD